MVVERIGSGHGLKQPLGGCGRGLALIPLRRGQDRKFVAAEPRDRIGVAQASHQTTRHHLEELVADRMPERIVDRFEDVQVQHEQVEGFAAAAQARQALQHLLAQDRAVGEVGEDIVARQVGDLRLGALLRCDILVDRDPAAVLHGLMADREDPPVTQLVHRIVWLRLGDLLQSLLDIMLGLVRTTAQRDARLQNGAQRRAGLGHLRREPVHFAVASVAHHQTLIAVEHAQTVRHVLERRIEQHVGLLQRALGRLELGGGGRELALTQHPDGDREKHDGGQEQADLIVFPRSQNGFLKYVAFGQPHGGDQRQSIDNPVGDQPFDLLESLVVARVPEAPDRILPKEPEHSAAGYGLTYISLCRGVTSAAGADNSVEPHQRDDPLAADVDGVVEFFELDDVERGPDDAAEGSVVRQQAPGQLDRGLAGQLADRRLADVELIRRRAQVNPKGLAIGDVDRGAYRSESRHPEDAIRTDDRHMYGQIAARCRAVDPIVEVEMYGILCV